MYLVSLRVITANVPRLVSFYERVTGIAADWAMPEFAEIRTPAGTLAIASARTVEGFAPGAVSPASNRSAIVEFLVDDVDAVAQRLAGDGPDVALVVVLEPTTMPWGNRSMLVRDPDGTLVNLFTPVTPAAKEKFAR